MDEWEDSDWRKPIAQYLKDPNIPVDRKMKSQAINFVLMADELYKKGIDGSLLRCLGQNDQNIALGEVHNGICSAHQAGKKMRWVLYCNHVYWPSMIKDCIDYAKACQECQKHGSIQQIPASELHSIIKPWPFRNWALDLIGLIHPPSSKHHKFILVAIDYFRKWVEVIPLIEVSQSEIIDFIEEHIIHRFGIPQTLSTDQEINLNTLRISKQNDLPVDDYWNAMFDELNELDSE
nr:protein NYNRIN-like [Arachis hypogaea]